MENQKEIWETDDMAVSAYFVLNGVEMINHNRVKNHICFYFNNKDGRCKQLEIDFINSTYRKYDSIIRDLKKLIKRN